MKKTRVIKINAVFIIIVVFIFAAIIFKLLWIGLGNVKVDDKPLAEFASNRDTRKKTLVHRVVEIEVIDGINNINKDLDNHSDY